MTSADGVGLSCLLDRHPAVDLSTAIRTRPKIFKKRFLALTARRQEVAMLAARGLSNRAIAEKLDLTEGTVKIHLHEIYKLLDLHSRIELVMAVGKLPRVKTRFKKDGNLDGSGIPAA